VKTLNMKSAKSLLFAAFCKYWLFFPAFLLMAVYLKTTGPMNNFSGDAANIWTCIKSFPTGTIVPSYVLYKGFGSVYPYVWLYQLSQYFGLSEFVFVKLFHCLLFAYVSAIGFPYIAERLLQIKPKAWRKALLILVMFWLWKSNLAFSQVMVDLPSLAYFILLVNSALKISEPDVGWKPVRYIYTGLLLGINICLSGQYSIAAMLVLLYIIIKTIPYRILCDNVKRWGALLCLAALLLCMASVKEYNNYFEKTVTNPLRNQGAWIPTDETWLSVGFLGRAGVMRWGGGLTIPDNRGLSVLQDYYGSEYEAIHARSIGAGYPISISEYFNIATHYPVDFASRYANRFFVAVTPDGGSLQVTRLFIIYSLVFAAVASIWYRCKTVKEFFASEILIVLSFAFSLSAVVILAVEARYAMQIQGLIFTAAILDDSIFASIKKYFQKTKTVSLGSKTIPYMFLMYILFISLCFMHMATIYESLGVDATAVLFK